MNDRGKVVYVVNPKWTIFICILGCLTIVLAPFFLWALFQLSKPLDMVSGFVTGKRTGTQSQTSGYGSSIWTSHYVTIASTELLVSSTAYQALAVGDYIRAAHRKGSMQYYTKQ